MNTIKMMNIIIMLLSTNLIFACNMKENDCNLQQFIGPKPGYKSIFKGNIFPLIYDVYYSIITDKYQIYIDNDALIKKFKNREEIVLKKPCIPNSNNWEIIGKTGNIEIPSHDNIVFNDFALSCKILRVGEESILGKEKLIIETRCVAKNRDSNIVRYEKYADGIGLVERSIKTLSNNKETEIYTFNIKEIEKTGEKTVVSP